MARLFTDVELPLNFTEVPLSAHVGFFDNAFHSSSTFSKIKNVTPSWLLLLRDTNGEG